MEVAVVIPAYNAALTIDATLQTVLMQAGAVFEIIVVDDGSTDGTSAIVEATLADKDVSWRLLVQARGGVSAARNAGWRSTNAEWVQFLDADDFLAPSKIRHQLDAIRSSDADLAWVSSPWEEVDVSAGGWRTTRRCDSAGIGGAPSEITILAQSPLLHLGQSLFRRTWVDLVDGFDVGFTADEDLEFYLALARRGATHANAPAKTPLFHYRKSNGRRLGGPGARYGAADVSGRFIAHVVRSAGDHPAALHDLPPADRRRLLERCSSYMRLLYRYRRAEFMARKPQLDAVFGKVLPVRPVYLAFIARYFGFAGAERVAGVYRGAKRFTGRHVD